MTLPRSKTSPPSKSLRRSKALRLPALALAAFGGLSTVPTEGADRHLEAPKPLVPMAAAERWRLRPAEPAAIAPATAGSLRGRPATAIPDERRNVRVVYPALVEAR